MSRESMLPCFVCGRVLTNAYSEADNQPEEGTEFRTYGHYGSTFWDSFDGEELVLNVCDPCLRERTGRLAQHKRYLPLRSSEGFLAGKQWVDRPMVAYTGSPDDTVGWVDDEDLGTDLPQVEWVDGAKELGRT